MTRLRPQTTGIGTPYSDFKIESSSSWLELLGLGANALDNRDTATDAPIAIAALAIIHLRG